MDPPVTSSFEARLGEMAGVRRLARSLLRDASRADDVVQEAALAAWQRERAGSDVPRSWWVAVVRNVAAKMKRGEARRSAREQAVARPEAQPGADAVARRLALHRAIVAAVEQLAPEQRDVVVRRWFDGAKPQRIASELGVPLATVKTRLRRALERLRERLKREWGDGVAGLLLSLARPRVAWSAGATATTGAIVMGAKLKFSLAAVAVVIACAWAGVELLSRGGRVRPAVGAIESIAAAGSDAKGDRSPESAATRVEQDAPRNEATTPAVDPRRVAKITGVVVGPHGPFAGARVELVRTIGHDLFAHPALRDALPERRLRTVSAADGSFEFADVDRGVGFSLEANAEPDLFGATSSSIRAGDHAFVTLIALARLAGVVHRGRGEPVAGATVVARTVGGADVSIERRATSDSAGRFAIERMTTWPVMVEAFTPAGDWMPPVRADMKPGATTEVELAFGEGFAVEGVVRDERDGHAIADARLYFASCETFGVVNRYVESVPVAVTDEKGEFRIRAGCAWPIPNFFVRAPGYGFQAFVAPKPSDPAPFVEVRLRPSRAIVGRVVDVERRPIADAVIAFNGAVDLHDPRGIAMRSELALARSGTDGAFRLEDVDTRSDHLLVVQHEGLATGFVGVIGNASDDDQDVGEIELKRGALLGGIVVDGEHRPVPQAWLFLEHETEGSAADPGERAREEFFAMREIGTCSRADGTFTFGDVAPGRWVLRSDERELASVRVPLTVVADEIREDLELLVDRGRTISGRVVDDEGRPVAAARVTVEIADFSRIRTTMLRPLPARSTEGDGSFALTGIPDGSYRLRARPVGTQRNSPRRLLAAAIDDVDTNRGDVTIVLHAGAFLFGAVSSADGTPYADASVEAVDAEGRRLGRASTDSRGAFELVVPRPDVQGATDSAATAARVRLVVNGAPRDPFASHPEPSCTTTVDDVELDGPELAIRFPATDR